MDDTLPPVNDAEGDLLDTLPDADSESRLACQLRVDEWGGSPAPVELISTLNGKRLLKS